jgi:hypothetical protein
MLKSDLGETQGESPDAQISPAVRSSPIQQNLNTPAQEVLNR